MLSFVGSSDHHLASTKWQKSVNNSEDSADEQSPKTSVSLTSSKTHNSDKSGLEIMCFFSWSLFAVSLYKLLGEYDPNRYRLNFRSESRAEIERRKHEAQTVPVQFVSERELEADIKEIYVPGSGKARCKQHCVPSITILTTFFWKLVLDMPKRPTWSYKMSKAQLESREASYFEKYLKEIYKKFGDRNLSYFEHNLEVRSANHVCQLFYP